MHAPLVGAERHAVDMGPVARRWFVERCPWGLVLGDPLVRPMLNAYASMKRFTLLPPGPRDPRTEAALHVLAGEHDAMDVEAIKRRP